MAQKIPAQEIVSCSGGDTQKKITRAYCGAAKNLRSSRAARLPRYGARAAQKTNPVAGKFCHARRNAIIRPAPVARCQRALSICDCLDAAFCTAKKMYSKYASIKMVIAITL